MKSVSVIALALGALLAVERAAAARVLVDADFDRIPTNALPAGWSVDAPQDTSAQIWRGFSVSGSQSLRFGKMTGSGGAYPRAIVSFQGVTGGIIRVSYAAATDTSNHDSLYVKLRNDAGRELGGLRFSTTGTVQFQLPGGDWQDTQATYKSGEWYRFRIEYDLDRFVYRAWMNGQSLVESTPFRVQTRTAASVIIQDRVVAGSGFSYIDNVKVEALPPDPRSAGAQ